MSLVNRALVVLLSAIVSGCGRVPSASLRYNRNPEIKVEDFIQQNNEGSVVAVTIRGRLITGQYGSGERFWLRLRDIADIDNVRATIQRKGTLASEFSAEPLPAWPYEALIASGLFIFRSWWKRYLSILAGIVILPGLVAALGSTEESLRLAAAILGVASWLIAGPNLVSFLEEIRTGMNGSILIYLLSLLYSCGIVMLFDFSVARSILAQAGIYQMSVLEVLRATEWTGEVFAGIAIECSVGFWLGLAATAVARGQF